MQEQLLLGALAITLGLVVAVVAFVPFVALAYRRQGQLTLRNVLVYVSVLVYFLAIWTYTLLPLPDPDTIRCTSAQLDVLRFVQDVQGALRRGHPLTDPATLQLALNVLLFVPLGFFLRVVWHRGIVVAVAVGFLLSLLVETTQLTGVWGLYPCSYRLFDVDDLLTNTLGAFLGSLLALLVPRRYRRKTTVDANAPRPVTAWRRLVAMVCDVLAVAMIGFTLSLGAAAAVYAFDPAALTRSTDVIDDVSAWGTLALTLCFTLVTGRTIGNAAVQLRYVGSRLPRLLAHLLRFVGGIGGYQVLLMWSDGVAVLLLILLVVGSLVTLFTTRDHRGLPGIVSGQRLVDSRAFDRSGSPIERGVARDDGAAGGAVPGR